MGTLDRGFKSWAERTAATLRRELTIGPLAPIDPFHVASFLDIDVRTPRDIPGLPEDVIDPLLEGDPYGWSAISLASDGGGGLLIYNPRKSKGRRASDIMHELAHFLLDHKPTTIIMSQELDLSIRSFDAKQEDEANWLAWAVLLPRDALVDCLRQRMNAQAIAEEYGVTETLVAFRRRITGAEYQLRASRRRT
jgi:Zn-dependent peptidase ImmA (M78 family)